MNVVREARRVQQQGAMATQNGRLAVRTILVTTRAAVRINRDAGNAVLAHGSVRRGRRLLEEYQNKRVADGRDEQLAELIEATRRELEALASETAEGEATATGAVASAQPARGET